MLFAACSARLGRSWRAWWPRSRRLSPLLLRCCSAACTRDGRSTPCAPPIPTACARRRLHPRHRVCGHRDRPGARARADARRPLGRPEPEPGRLRPRQPSERARRRPERELVVRMARRRPPLGYLLPGAAAVLGARDADSAEPHPAHPSPRDDLVPPSHGSRLGVGAAEHGCRPHLRPRGGHALLPPPLAARNGNELAEPPPPRLGVLHGRAAGREPLAAAGAPPRCTRSCGSPRRSASHPSSRTPRRFNARPAVPLARSSSEARLAARTDRRERSRGEGEHQQVRWSAAAVRRGSSSP